VCVTPLKSKHTASGGGFRSTCPVFAGGLADEHCDGRVTPSGDLGASMAVNFSAWATYRRARIRVPQRCPQLVFRRSTQRERVRYGRVSATEASSRERGSISPCFKNLSDRASLGEGVDFVAFQKSLRAAQGRRPISSRFKNRSKRLGEGADFVTFQKSRRAIRRGGRIGSCFGI
jgi:hypothetical protein